MLLCVFQFVFVLMTRQRMLLWKTSIMCVIIVLLNVKRSLLYENVIFKSFDKNGPIYLCADVTFLFDVFEILKVSF